MTPKASRESATEMTEIVLPSDGNTLGSAFGGRVTSWIDICAAIAAQRHCRRIVVTASMDELHFHAPIRVGMIASLSARVQATFQHSLEVAVDVHSESPLTGERRHCCSALLTFTALDESGKPAPVPPLRFESDEEKAKQAEAEARRAYRLQNRRRSKLPTVPAAPAKSTEPKGNA
jgi:acyl-CoA hydrolase